MGIFNSSSRRPGKFTGRMASSIAVSPPTLSLSSGTSTLTAVVYDQFGVVMAGVSPDAWQSSGTGVVTVNSSGVVTFVGAGGPVSVTSKITATGLTSSACQVTGTTVSGTNLLKMDFETMTASGPTTFTGSPQGKTMQDDWGAGISIATTAPGRTGGTAKFSYATNPAGGQIDSNYALNTSTADVSLGLGQTLWFKGDFRCSTTNAASGSQRKLLYWGWSNDTWGFQRAFDMVVTSFDNQWAISCPVTDASGVVGSAFGPDVTVSGHLWYGPTTFPRDQWATIKVQLVINSTFGTADGILRVWCDTGSGFTLIFQCLDMKFTSSTWPEAPSTYQWVRFNVGDQLDSGGAGVAQSEDRYWDNVSFATTEATL